jgi:syringomycin synthetase protein SyrE
MRWLGEHWGITPDDCAGQSTQITFDPSLIEWCLALTHGARVALPAPGRLLPESLASFAVKYGVTFMAFVPSTLSRFLDGVESAEGLKLRVACSGGEVLAPDLVRRFHTLTGAKLYNVYGPTEAAIFATAWLADSGLSQKVLPIGKPITDARIYVLDDRQALLPLGSSGEIYIGGGGVARGYLHRPDLTELAFLPDPFCPGGRIYRTGDRGRMTPDGMLHFAGRLDRQVKLRGYRIELAEIEAAMRHLPDVKQAAAKLIDRCGKPEIHGWVGGPHAPASAAVLRVLRQKLPSYMVPTAITMLPELPESSSGKIDYHQLSPAESGSLLGGSGRNPENELERELLTMWQQALKKPELTVEDNFFDAGGDSLAAIGVLTGIEKLIGRRVPMYLLSERPTVESLAASLGEGSSPSKLLVNLSGSTAGTSAEYLSDAPLYLAASGHGDMMRFQTLARALEGIIEVRMLQPPTASTVSRTADLADLYIEAIRAQGAAACYVAGFSVGGLAALETANRLLRSGVEVRGLFLIDTIYPSRLWGGTVLWRLSGWLVKALHIQDLSMNGRRLGAMLSDQGLIGQVMAVSGYRAPKFEGTTHLIKSVALAKLFDRLLFLGWRMLLGKRLLEYSVQGLHGSMFEAHNIEGLATVIRVATTADHPTPVQNGAPTSHG